MRQASHSTGFDPDVLPKKLTEKQYTFTFKAIRSWVKEESSLLDDEVVALAAF